MNPEDLRADVADVLDAPVASIPLSDNLIEHGLDSVRIMELTERWRADYGAEITFADLAERPTLTDWARLLHAAA